MSEVPFMAFFIILLVFTILDKGLTYASLNELSKKNNYNETISAERNPLARGMFKQFGLFGGTVVMFLFSMVWMTLIWYGIGWIFGFSYHSKLLYIILLSAGIVVGNNIFYYLRFRGVY